MNSGLLDGQAPEFVDELADAALIDPDGQQLGPVGGHDPGRGHSARRGQAGVDQSLGLVQIAVQMGDARLHPLRLPLPRRFPEHVGLPAC